MNPNYGQCYRLLRDLFQATEETELDRQVSADLISGKRTDPDFYFGLGKLYDDLKDYDRAWDCYTKGNALTHESNMANPETVQDITKTGQALRDLILRYIDQNGTAHREHTINAVLVAGFPRSGTTMFENVLASDPHFSGWGELPFSAYGESALMARKKDGEPLNANDIADFGDYYSACLKNLKLGNSMAVDKGTSLFRKIGLFMLSSHTVKAFCLIRDPKDVLLSNFKARFTVGMHFTYSIPETINYLKFYYELTQLWLELFPDRIWKLSYDDYVSNPTHENEKIAKWLGGENTSYKFSFRSSKRIIQTASATQLGNQVRKTSTGRAKAYETYFKPWEEQITALYHRYNSFE